MSEKRLLHEFRHREAGYQSRRNFLRNGTLGLGGLALGSLFGCGETERFAVTPQERAMETALSYVPKAKRVIYLHMAGAPSQLEMFDYKPELQKLDGKPCPPSLLAGKRFAFIQLYDWGWDHHGTNRDTSIDLGLPEQCRSIDRPMTALLKDLKQRGMLEDTLVVWGGEFGRTPMRENRGGVTMPFLGRDHHGEAFTMWMAGGGVKPGVTYGETDAIGYAGVRDRAHVHDVQATMLSLLGFDHERFTYPFQGRDFRLTDVSGRVIGDVVG